MEAFSTRRAEAVATTREMTFPKVRCDALVNIGRILLRDGDPGRAAQPVALAEEAVGVIGDGLKHARALLENVRLQLDGSAGWRQVLSDEDRKSVPVLPRAAFGHPQRNGGSNTPVWQREGNMTRSGGSIALNGFLYQILHHLDWSADVSLTSTLDRKEVKDGCLVLEPREGGGDAQARASGLHLVEQYKTRASGTWSLSDVITVLRDLRKSVPDYLPDHARYRFVTNGRLGRLGEFRKFIACLDAVEDPDELDNTTKRKFTGELHLEDQAFLDHLAMATRDGNAGSVTSEERKLVFHLVRRFELEPCVGLEDLAADIDTRLRPYVENLGDETGVRMHLVGELMERLSEGETRLDRDELSTMLQEAGISPDRLRKVGELARTLAGGRRQRSKYIRYRHEVDVRDALRWSGSKPVCLIAGESGAGKSWQLASLMEVMTGGGEPIVFVRGTGTTEDILT